MDAQRQDLLGIFLYASGGCAKDGHIHGLQLLDVLHDGIVIQLGRTVLGARATHDTRNLKIRRCLQSLEHIVPDIAITNDGCSYFFHTFISFNYQFSVLRLQK